MRFISIAAFGACIGILSRQPEVSAKSAELEESSLEAVMQLATSLASEDLLQPGCPIHSFRKRLRDLILVCVPSRGDVPLSGEAKASA